MTLTDKLTHAARSSFSPVFSLFGVDTQGHWELITQSCVPAVIAERFADECANWDGLEIRCNGVRVDI